MTMFSDPSKLEEILSKGAFEPQTTPEQKATLERLETLLALVEGWVDTVVKQALGERLPGVGALSETLRRRRAAGGPAEQTFATLVGLELRPRKLREAAALWQQLTEQRGIEVRDAVWEHPDLMPDSNDLDDPSAFIAHTGVSSSDFDEALRKLSEGDPGEEPK
jgi:putative hydrolase